MECGKTYLLYDDDDPASKPHLHVVISDPNASNQIVLVSVTTQRAKSDMMTPLAAGIHPFIVNASVISYNYSKMMTCDQLQKLIDTGAAIPKADAREELVRRAQDGMQETRRAAPEVKECFCEWWATQQTQ